MTINHCPPRFFTLIPDPLGAILVPKKLFLCSKPMNRFTIKVYCRLRVPRYVVIVASSSKPLDYRIYKYVCPLFNTPKQPVYLSIEVRMEDARDRLHL